MTYAIFAALSLALVGCTEHGRSSRALDHVFDLPDSYGPRGGQHVNPNRSPYAPVYTRRPDTGP
jgi:hypothetical protein